MKKYLILIIFLLAVNNKIQAQWATIPVGDTAFIANIQVSIQGCALGSSDLKHKNKDFFFVTKNMYESAVYFAPTTVGFQRDTFIYTAYWDSHFSDTNQCHPITYSQLYILASGIPAKNSVGQTLLPGESQVTCLVSDNHISFKTNFPHEVHVGLKVYDNLGLSHFLENPEMEIPAGESSQRIELGNLPNGWYMLRIKMENKIITKNFILLR